METKHTPGPLSVLPMTDPNNEENHEGFKVVTSTGLKVADCFYQGCDGEELSMETAEANAILMAASADLLEALIFVQKALAEWRDGSEETHHPEHDWIHLEEVKYLVVDTAIDKATK